VDEQRDRKCALNSKLMCDDRLGKDKIRRKEEERQFDSKSAQWVVGKSKTESLRLEESKCKVKSTRRHYDGEEDTDEGVPLNGGLGTGRCGGLREMMEDADGASATWYEVGMKGML